MIIVILVLIMLCSFSGAEAQKKAECQIADQVITHDSERVLFVGGLVYGNNITCSGMTFNRLLAKTEGGEVIVLKEVGRYLQPCSNNDSDCVASIMEGFEVPNDVKLIGIDCTFYDSFGINGYLEFEGKGQTPVTILNSNQTFWGALPSGFNGEMWMFLHFYGE